MSWNSFGKFLTFLWLNMIWVTVVVSGGLEGFFAFVHNKASETGKKIEKKLKDWDKSYEWQLINAGALIKTIIPEDIKSCTELVSYKSGFEVLCTYAWKNTPLELNTSTIYVPGFSRIFSPPTLPFKVAPDEGEFWRDQHLARSRTFQFEPLFQALCFMNPEIRFDDVDIVISRSNLLVLLDIVDSKNKSSFALELKLVSKTLFISTKGGKGKVGTGNESYGRNFEEKFTKPTGEADADGYHRVLRFKLGSLNLVVRLEADAYRENGGTLVECRSDEPFHGYKTIDPSSQHSGIMHPYATAVITGGEYIPQSKITELKTTNGGIGGVINRSMAQIWVGHNDTIVVGDRKSGLSVKIPKKNSAKKISPVENEVPNDKDAETEKFATFYKADLQDIKKARSVWEEECQPSLQNLSGFLMELIEAVGQVEEGKAVLRKAEKMGPLELYEGKSSMPDALPMEISDIFWK